MSFKFSNVKKYIKRAKQLSIMPPNEATPHTLMQTLSEEFGDHARAFGSSIWDEGETPLIEAVDPDNGRMLVFYHKVFDLDESPKKPMVIIGKGVCFDTGGYNLKHSSMHEMKFDKCGGMAAYSIIKACKDQDYPDPVVVIVPLVQNLIGTNKTLPGSVFTATDGTKVEIRDTDAEGRLILADAINFARKYLNPEVVITVATLTGSCSAALGEHYTGLFSNLIEKDELSRSPLTDMVIASEESKDHVWPMPLNKHHIDNLKKSKVADILNYNKKELGGSSGAAFLSHFVKDTPWMHLDIAGTAYKDDVATGRPVSLLLRWLELQTEKSEE